MTQNGAKRSLMAIMSSSIFFRTKLLHNQIQIFDRDLASLSRSYKWQKSWDHVYEIVVPLNARWRCCIKLTMLLSFVNIVNIAEIVCYSWEFHRFAQHYNHCSALIAENFGVSTGVFSLKLKSFEKLLDDFFCIE